MDALDTRRVTFPEIRVELIDRVELLADKAYQQQYWASREPHLDFRYIVSYLFDSSPLAEATFECIGTILFDEMEARFVEAICNKIDALFDAYGNNQSDEFYLHAPEWDALVDEASAFLSILKK